MEFPQIQGAVQNACTTNTSEDARLGSQRPALGLDAFIDNFLLAHSLPAWCVLLLTPESLLAANEQKVVCPV